MVKSPFAALNWGVFQPESGYIVLLKISSASGGMDSDTSLYGTTSKVYTTFATAFEKLFQLAAKQMDNRVEWFLESMETQSMTMSDISNELGLDRTPSIFDLQGYYNEAPQTAELTLFSIYDHEYIDNPQKPFRQLCRDVWNRLSKLQSFATWNDYQALTRRTLTDSEREQLNQAFEQVIDLIPPMNLKGIMSFQTEFVDDYYSSETQINLELLPRNMEGRA